MSRILKVSQSNYRVAVQSGGTITLDTGLNTGDVVITGNLTVNGNYTTINVSDMKVEDNILVLNKNEENAGITLGRSGIEIERGTLSNAQLLFDENVQHWDPITSSYIAGTFVVKTADGALSGVQTSVITNDGTTDIVFDLQGGPGVLSVAHSISSLDGLNYEDRVTFADAIPNKKWVEGYISSGAYTIGMADVDKLYKKDALNNERSRVQALLSGIDIRVNDVRRAYITASGLNVDNINIYSDTISNTSATNLILTANNKLVEVDATLVLDDQNGNIPTTTIGKTKVYSLANVGPGKSGLFFKNVNHSDELIAKNRAVLFSMLF